MPNIHEKINSLDIAVISLLDMSIQIWEGNTGQGKTYLSSRDAITLLRRNVAWHKSGKIKTIRKIATNIALNKTILDSFPEYITYWDNLEQLVGLRECDVIFDDMAAYLDSQRFKDTPMSVKRWLRLHEHYGCDIYGNAQDFLTIDISVRRLVSSVYRVKKFIGSRRPSATKPAVKRVWGFLLARAVDPKDFVKESIERNYTGIPQIYFLRKKTCLVFDTTQDIQLAEWPALKHIERRCENPSCSKHHSPVISHA